jgi:hypothetical protein
MGDESCFSCQYMLEHCQCDNTHSYSDDAPVCPYCGYKEDRSSMASDKFEEGLQIYKCDSCDKEYNLETLVLRTWTGTRRDD